jgi:hypothetical protein
MDQQGKHCRELGGTDTLDDDFSITGVILP